MFVTKEGSLFGFGDNARGGFYFSQSATQRSQAIINMEANELFANEERGKELARIAELKCSIECLIKQEEHESTSFDCLPSSAEAALGEIASIAGVCAMPRFAEKRDLDEFIVAAEAKVKAKSHYGTSPVQASQVQWHDHNRLCAPATGSAPAQVGTLGELSIDFAMRRVKKDGSYCSESALLIGPDTSNSYGSIDYAKARDVRFEVETKDVSVPVLNPTTEEVDSVPMSEWLRNFGKYNQVTGANKDWGVGWDKAYTTVQFCVFKQVIMGNEAAGEDEEVNIEPTVVAVYAKYPKKVNVGVMTSFGSVCSPPELSGPTPLCVPMMKKASFRRLAVAKAETAKPEGDTAADVAAAYEKVELRAIKNGQAPGGVMGPACINMDENGHLRPCSDTAIFYTFESEDPPMTRSLRGCDANDGSQFRSWSADEGLSRARVGPGIKGPAPPPYDANERRTPKKGGKILMFIVSYSYCPGDVITKAQARQALEEQAALTRLAASTSDKNIDLSAVLIQLKNKEELCAKEAETRARYIQQKRFWQGGVPEAVAHAQKKLRGEEGGSDGL